MNVEPSNLSWFQQFDHYLWFLLQVMWYGNVLETSGQDEITLSLQHFNRTLAKDTRIDLIMLNVGDGFTLAMKK